MDKEKGVHNRRMSEVLKGLAESSSWHGIPKIASSRQRPVKFLWCLLMIGAFGFLMWQLSELFKTFQSHPVQTTVSLDFSSHRFPAVSFCNLNPVRKSLLGSSPELFKLLYQRKNATNSSMVTTTSSATSLDAVTRSTQATSLAIKSTVTPSPTLNSTEFSSPIKNSSESPFSNSRNTDILTTKNRTETKESDIDDDYPRIMDDYDYDCYYYDYEDCDYYEYEIAERKNDNTSYSQLYEDPRDKWEEKIRTFKTKFRNESVNKRRHMGHQKQDFIHRATYASRQQNVTNHFTEFTSSDYGNCFTMDSPKFIAWRSGPDHGIKLRLNLEVDEYIKNFASGYGVRMVFHQPGTFPMPAEEGLTLSPGYETMIGLKVVNITRLDYPFGNCTDGEDFRRRYNVTYSVASCMEFCRVEMTIEECKCIPYDAPDLQFSREGLNACDNQNIIEDNCADNVNYNFERGKSVCDCISPCRETVYEKTISGRRWPNDDYLEKVLMADTCRRNISSMQKACSQLKNKTFDYDRYRYNFIRVRIYFEELNYKQITEHEAYKPVRFVSDIGGAMGLFLGASLLSVLELFQLIMEIVLHARKPKQTRTSDNTTSSQYHRNGSFSPVYK